MFKEQSTIIISKLKNINHPKRTIAITLLLIAFALTPFDSFGLATMLFFSISYLFVSIIFDEAQKLKDEAQKLKEEEWRREVLPVLREQYSHLNDQSFARKVPYLMNAFPSINSIQQNRTRDTSKKLTMAPRTNNEVRRQNISPG